MVVTRHSSSKKNNRQQLLNRIANRKPRRIHVQKYTPRPITTLSNQIFAPSRTQTIIWKTVYYHETWRLSMHFHCGCDCWFSFLRGFKKFRSRTPSSVLTAANRCACGPLKRLPRKREILKFRAGSSQSYVGHVPLASLALPVGEWSTGSTRSCFVFRYRLRLGLPLAARRRQFCATCTELSLHARCCPSRIGFPLNVGAYANIVHRHLSRVVASVQLDDELAGSQSRSRLAAPQPSVRGCATRPLMTCTSGPVHVDQQRVAV